MLYRTCPVCGSSLDPGERCDCEDERNVREPERRTTPYDRAKAAVHATGNKWAIENFHATHD